MADHGQEKNAGSCENLFRAFGDRSISLSRMGWGCDLAIEGMILTLCMDSIPANAVKSAFFMRLTQKTALREPGAENHMLYSICARPDWQVRLNFHALGFTWGSEYAI
jgi:hypothetical protein